MTNPIEAVRASGARGFFASLARYYSTFLDTDFKKDRLPKRRIENKDRKNRVVGIPLQKYPGFQQKIWDVINKPISAGNNSTGTRFQISRGTYRSSIPQAIRDVIARHVEGLQTEGLNSRIRQIVDEFTSRAAGEQQDPELFKEAFVDSIRIAVAQITVGPLLSRMEGFFSRTENRPIESMLELEDQLSALLTSVIEDNSGEAISALLVDQNQTAIQTIVNDQLSLSAIKNKLGTFFETFTSGDLFVDLCDIEMSSRILENSELYLHLGELHFRNHTYPLFYIPLSMERKHNTFVLETEPHLYVNKKAVDYITQEINPESRRASVVKERLYYLESDDVPVERMQEITDRVSTACNLRSDVNFSISRVQTTKSTEMSLNNRSTLSLFDKSDESMVNDYESILTGLETGGDVIKAFEELVGKFLTTNPVDSTLEVDSVWDETPLEGRLVFDTPLPLVEEQRKILTAINNPDVRFIAVEGPPGTGKSHTITAIAFQAILSGKSLLILSDKKEALDVVEGKIDSVLAKVRMGDDFQNPILRLGKTSSNYNKVLNNATIEKIKTQLKVTKVRERELSEKLAQETENLKENLKASATAYAGIDIAKIQKVCVQEQELLDDFPELGDDHIRRVFYNFISLRESLKVLGEEAQYWCSKVGGGLNAIGALSYLAKALDLTTLDVKAIKLFKTFKPEQIDPLSRLIARIDNAKMFLFGYLFAGTKLQEISLALCEEMKTNITEPQKYIKELRAAHSSFLQINERLKRVMVSEELFSVAVEMISSGRIKQAADLDQEIKTAKWLNEQFEDEDFPYPDMAEDPIAALFDSRHPMADDFELYAGFCRDFKTVSRDFMQIPAFDYLGAKTRIESLNSQRLAQVIDERVVDFYYNRKADAKTLAKIIRAKGKFPTEKFQELRRAFPCIIAGLRDYAEFIPLERDMFDLVIIDEASQVSIAQAMPAILRAKKMVVFGDRRQFGNVKTTQASREINNAYMNDLLDEFSEEYGANDLSAMERAKVFNIRNSLMDFMEMTSNFSIQLRKHFRGYPEMISFSSEYFYGNHLQAMKIRGKSIEDVLAFHSLKHDGLLDPTKNTNQMEAKHILSEIEKYLEAENPPTIGVITPHTEQQNLISRLCHDHPAGRELFSKLRLKVMTFDTCQGEERDIIYYSLVATQVKDRLSHVFPSSLEADDDVIDHNLRMQRLNVGLSRGKEKLVFVHSKPLENYKSAMRDVLIHYRNVLERARNMPTVEDVDPRSPAERKVLHWLSQCPLLIGLGNAVEIQAQFELGRYLKSLDPTYQHPEYCVDFLLRIRDENIVHHIIVEYDGFEYHFKDSSDINAENWEYFLSENDIEREKVLESFGYKMLRINRFNVGDDPVLTLNKRIDHLLQSLLEGRKPHELVSSLVTESEQVHNGLQNGSHKHCKKCDQIKNLSDFEDPNTKSGHGRICRACKGPISANYGYRNRRKYRYRY